MRTEVRIRHLYPFSDLSEAAQERAVEAYRDAHAGDAHAWGAEYRDSLEAFCRIAPIVATGWEYGSYRNDHIDTEFEDGDIADLSGLRAWKWLNNNGPDFRDGRADDDLSWFEAARREVVGGCTLTGFQADAPLFDPIHNAERNPLSITSLGDLFHECCEAWLESATEDYEWQSSDEYIREELVALYYEFEADGTLVE